LLVSPSAMMATYFVCGWPYILATNAAVPAWVKWVAATVMMAFCLVAVRGMAYFAAIPEPNLNWTFARIFFYRVMTPGARQRLEAKMAIPAVGARAVPVAAVD